MPEKVFGIFINCALRFFSHGAFKILKHNPEPLQLFKQKNFILIAFLGSGISDFKVLTGFLYISDVRQFV